MSNDPNSFPEDSSRFAAVSAQMRQRKVDVLAEMRRIVEEHNGVTYTPEEWAKQRLSTWVDRTQCTPEENTAELRRMAEDYRCQGNTELAAGLNHIADLGEDNPNS